jgi:hypothetical protein
MKKIKCCEKEKYYYYYYIIEYLLINLNKKLPKKGYQSVMLFKLICYKKYVFNKQKYIFKHLLKQWFKQ